VVRQLPGYYPDDDVLGDYLVQPILDEAGEAMLDESGVLIEQEHA
jgi:hypothetical protein